MSAETHETDGAPAAIPFPMPRPTGCPFDPPDEFTRLRSEQPISRIKLWNGNTAWFITRYEDVRAVLSDARFSSDAMHPSYPNETAALQEHRAHQKMLLTMDPPEHTALRRMLTRDFLVKRLEKMRPEIQATVDGLIDEMLTKPQPVDLVKEFALPLPAMVVSGVLGVPTDDRHFFADLVDTMTDVTIGPEKAREANEAYSSYVEKLLDAKEADPGADLISRVLVDHVQTGELSREDLVVNIRLLLVAAFESTANQIGLGVALLLKHPEQLERLRNDPTLIGSAVEEILRYATIDQFGRRRVATEDIEIGGQLIRAGEGVVVSQSSANRDGDVFADADAFDIGRNARDHMAFSYGVHQCLGQALARIEMQIAFATLFERLPDVRLAVPFEDLRFKDDRALYGIYELPLAWSTSVPAAAR